MLHVVIPRTTPTTLASVNFSQMKRFGLQQAIIKTTLWIFSTIFISTLNSENREDGVL